MTAPPPTDVASRLIVPETNRQKLALIAGAVGIVFGDIGTSPLYTLQECVSGEHGVAPSPQNVLGIVSLIVWAVTLVVSVKYVAFLMRADNQGEGGILALLALVPERVHGSDSTKIGAVALLVIAGAALMFGDGIITPAISVLSAIEGLEIVYPEARHIVVPTTVAILIALFAMQPRGTASISKLFAPVMLLWFTTIGVLGATRMFDDTRILSALSPHHGVRFFADHGWHGITILGSVVLAVTGGEALYADLGHFGRKPIQRAWYFVVYPALVLCYLGQGATLLRHPEVSTRPFFGMVPPGGWTIALVAIAAPATVIASQALITGVFSLTHQAIRLGFFPRLTVRHTSGESEGQIYLPLLNWGLAISCIALVLAFKRSGELATAFGLAVSGTMLVTSIVYFVVARQAWNWSAPKAWGLLLFFLSFDIPFLIANALKFFDGGYLPFTIGALFALVMVSWRLGRALMNRILTSRTQPMDEFLAELPSKVMARIPGVAVFMSSSSEWSPPVLTRTVERFRSRHETVLVVTVETEHVPFVSVAKRTSIAPLGDGIHRVVLRYGFLESPSVPAALAKVLSTTAPEARLDQITYFLGRETIQPGPSGQMNPVLEHVFAFLQRNARDPTAYFDLPHEQVIELGSRLDL